jgi:predicted DNA-binding transcriptional regulator YafY
MAITKNVLLRYQTLDRCFKNNGRSYLIEELLEEVNQTLFDENPENSGIQVRQLREDIRFMRSELGYSAPIETRVISGKKHSYYYSDPSFSINNSPLNSTEVEQLKSVLTLLNRFQGSPGFEWLTEMSVILKDTFHIKSNDKKVISFESNIDYTGHEFITSIFNAIVNKRVLKINYMPFGKDAHELIFHPYHLKQFNNRWFVFGLYQNLDVPAWNLALDRIASMNEIHDEYVVDDTDWDYYFSEIIGVSKPFEKEEEEIQLLFTPKQSPYIKTKPIHESQKDYEIEEGLLVKIKVIPNFELEQLILSFGENVKVLSPFHLIDKIKQRISESLNQY